MSSRLSSGSAPLDVTCAIIEREDGMVLAALRGGEMHLAGMWEFPGGKLREGESPEDCVRREIMEELALDVEPLMALAPSLHHYPSKSIRLLPYVCRLVGGGLALREHESAIWLGREGLSGLAWCPADLPVLAEYLALRSGIER